LEDIMATADGISMMNPGLGISGITAPRTEEYAIPARKTDLSPALSLAGSEQGLSTYEGQNLAAVMDKYLTPKARNPDLMSPQVFERTLAGALDKLAASGEVLAELNTDIKENNDILRMFSSLVVQG